MNLFCSEELDEIKNVLQSYLKENKQIVECTDFINLLDDSTDFERNKYKEIESILDYYIKADGKVDKRNFKDIMLDIEELESKGQGVFTKTNIIVSILTIVAGFLFTAMNDSIFLLIVTGTGLIWAYLSRYIGLKKEIDTGYIWGYCLGIIGFIVVCVLQGENSKEQTSNSNKYEDLEKLQKLKDSGAITDIEFEVEKQKLLR